MNDKIWFKLMNLGSNLGCHQMASRSFFYKGYQFPICARCLGVIISSIIAFFLFFIYRINFLIALLLSLVMLFDWLIQYLGIKESNNPRRLITGLIGGLGWATIHMYLYYYIWILIYNFFNNG